MPRILFQMNYDIHPEKRDEYLTTVRELETYIKEHSEHNYLVVEDNFATTSLFIQKNFKLHILHIPTEVCQQFLPV